MEDSLVETFDRRSCKLLAHSHSTHPHLPSAPLSYREEKVKLLPGTPGGPLDSTNARMDNEKLSLTYEHLFFRHHNTC